LLRISHRPRGDGCGREPHTALRGFEQFRRNVAKRSDSSGAAELHRVARPFVCGTVLRVGSLPASPLSTPQLHSASLLTKNSTDGLTVTGEPVGNLNPTVVVVLVFAIVVIVAAFMFRNDLKVSLSALGAKLTLKGKGREAKKTTATGGGIRRNWFLGKVRAETEGNAGIEDTTAAGDIGLKAKESRPSGVAPAGRRRKH